MNQSAVALQTTHVTPARRAATMSALSRHWAPGDPVAVWFLSQPTAEEIASGELGEFEGVANPTGARLFAVGFWLWVDAGLGAAAILRAVPAVLEEARRLTEFQEEGSS